MNFNLFKKKKDDELDLGYGNSIKTSQTNAGNIRNPSTYKTTQDYSNLLLSNAKPKTSSTSTLTSRLMNNQNLLNGTPNSRKVGLTPGLDKITGQTMQQRLDQKSNAAKTQTPNEFYNYKIDSNKLPPAPEQKTEQRPGYLGQFENITNDRLSLAEQQKQQKENYYNQAYGEQNKLLQDYIPSLQKQFQGVKGSIEKGMALAGQEADMTKQSATDEWGNSQRLAAQTRAESEARNRGQFANLNTADSYGYGSYGQAKENTESDFNRFTQEGLRQKEQNLFQIDKALQEYNIEAQSNLDSMEIDLNNAIMQIQSDIRMNNIDKQNAIENVLTQYQDAVSTINENLQKVYMDYEQEKAKLAQDSLSSQFMNTGVPQTETDYRFYLSNYDTYKDMTGSSETQEKGDTIALIDKVLNSNTKALTGNIALQGVPFFNRSQVADTKNQISQIKAQLELAAAGKLKGQGAISENERRILGDSVLALNQRDNGSFAISDDELKRQLSQAKAILERSGATSTANVDPYQFVK